VPISKTVGANRIIPSVANPHPLGDPDMPREEEKYIRRRLIEQALLALESEISDQRVFDEVVSAN